MRYIQPDFFDDFSCLASACKHTCCAGWEIDIDEETLDMYKQLPGPAGDSLRSCISCESTPHFILKENGVCPLLQENGLCKLILTYGEEALCDICNEHPRFYNCYLNTTEIGLGLCCEAVLPLLLDRKGSLAFEEWTDGEEAYSNISDSVAEDAFLRRKGEIIAFVQNEDIAFNTRLDTLLDRNSPGGFPSFSEAAEFLLSLEIMDSAWKNLLLSCQEETHPQYTPSAGRVAAYFIYRHLSMNSSFEESACIWFSLFSVWFTACLCSMGFEQPEVLRLYSSEIEYSDENIQQIIQRFYQSISH